MRTRYDRYRFFRSYGIPADVAYYAAGFSVGMALGDGDAVFIRRNIDSIRRSYGPGGLYAGVI